MFNSTSSINPTTFNSQVVLFQKNEAPGYGEIAVAWHVIQNCGIGDNHPFEFPIGMSVAASDSYGNFTPQLPANPGDAFTMAITQSGDQLIASGNATSPTDVQVTNALGTGSINVWIYKGGKKLATKTNAVPMEKAVFVLKPKLFIGVASQVVEGAIMDSAVISAINTQLSLVGIASADIIMTGGGSGPTSTPYKFTISNVVMA